MEVAAYMYEFPDDGYLEVEILRKNPRSNIHPVAAALIVVFCGHEYAFVSKQYFSDGHTPGEDEFVGQKEGEEQGITSVVPPGQYAPA